MNKERFMFRVWDKEYLRYVKSTPVITQNGDVGEYEIGMGLVLYPNCTIEQCTGLKDKNGKLIYEGDVLYHFDFGKREVFFSVDTASFMLRSLQPIPVKGMEDTFMTWYFCREIISDFCIIGNIHEMDIEK